MNKSFKIWWSTTYLFFLFFRIEVWSTYNIILVSSVHHSYLTFEYIVKLLKPWLRLHPPPVHDPPGPSEWNPVPQPAIPGMTLLILSIPSDTRRNPGFLNLPGSVPPPSFYTRWSLCLKHSSDTPSHWLSEMGPHPGEPHRPGHRGLGCRDVSGCPSLVALGFGWRSGRVKAWRTRKVCQPGCCYQSPWAEWGQLTVHIQALVWVSKPLRPASVQDSDSSGALPAVTSGPTQPPGVAEPMSYYHLKSIELVVMFPFSFHSWFWQLLHSFFLIGLVRCLFLLSF